MDHNRLRVSCLRHTYRRGDEEEERRKQQCTTTAEKKKAGDRSLLLLCWCCVIHPHAASQRKDAKLLASDQWGKHTINITFNRGKHIIYIAPLPFPLSIYTTYISGKGCTEWNLQKQLDHLPSWCGAGRNPDCNPIDGLSASEANFQIWIALFWNINDFRTKASPLPSLHSSSTITQDLSCRHIVSYALSRNSRRWRNPPPNFSLLYCRTVPSTMKADEGL